MLSKNSSAIFCSLINNVLEDASSFSTAYMDDIIVFSQTPEEHIRHLEEVFDWLRRHKLRLILTNFKRMKERIAEVHMMCHPDLSAIFVLYTDASDKCIGAALFQEIKDGVEIIPGIRNERPI